MKIIFCALLFSLLSGLASAAPVVMTSLTVCPDKSSAVKSEIQSETVTWAKDGDKQTITFDVINPHGTTSNTFAVASVDQAESGASNVNYINSQNIQKSITIYCDAVMDEDNGLLATFNCQKDW